MAKYGLCIGINDYPGTDSDLFGCINDANDWAAELTARGYQVTSMINEEATGANIRQAIRSLVAGAQRGDVVLIQFSGHGSFVPDVDGDEPDGTDECLCPYDTADNGTITDDEMFELFSAKKYGAQVVMISDSCHSGSVVRFAPIRTPPTTRSAHPPQRKVRFLPPAAFLSKNKLSKMGLRRSVRASSPPGRYASLLLSGCQDTEYSFDGIFNDRPNGVFSFVALECLRQLPVDATFADWHKVIREFLPSQQYPQSPNLYGSRSMRRWTIP